MNYNFNQLFPDVQLIGIGILLMAVVVAIVAAFRVVKSRDNKIFFFGVLVFLLVVSGIAVNSRTKYVVKDYVENKNYILVVAEPGLFENTYVQVDYRDYWKYMNWNTYRIDNEKQVIYMRTNKFY